MIMHRNLRRTWRSLVLTVAVTTSMASAHSAFAQTGQTPLALAPGAPAGSYSLSDLEEINLFSGSLLLRLPLLELRGRGESGVDVTLPIEQHWRAERSDESAFYPRFNWWRSFKPGYGPGLVQAYRDSDMSGEDSYLLTRMVYTGGDGTEHELRDVLTDGAPCANTGGATCSRGNVYQTRDGTAATFLSETVITDFTTNLDLTGYLLLRDGTRCRVENNLIVWTRDRNGNRFAFSYVTPPQHDDYVYTPFRGRQVSQITDSLNRTVTFAYAQPYHPVTNPVPADTITFRGAAGASRTLRVEYRKLQASLAAGHVLSTLQMLFPLIPWGLPNTQHNPLVVSAVVLPNGRQYTLRYNGYGELAEVVLPTQGRIEYSHMGGAPDGAHITRRLSERRVYPDPATPTTMKEKTVYSDEMASPPPSGTDQVVHVDHIDPATGGSLRQTRHYFHGRASANLILPPIDYPNWRHGREFRTETYEGVTLWRAVDRVWTQDDTSVNRAQNPRLASTTTTLDTGEQSTQFFDYDEYNNRISTIETGFGIGTFGPLVRKTEIDFLTLPYAPAGHPARNYAADLFLHMRELQREQRIYSWNGNTWDLAARTTYDYDNYTNDGAHAPLFDYGPNLTGLDSIFDGPYPYRGNVTKVTRWLDDPPGEVVTHERYDIAGSVVGSLDARGFLTSYQYAEHFGTPTGSVTDDSTPSELDVDGTILKTHAFATVVTNPLGHVVQKQVDYYLGKPVDSQDPNGVISTSVFGDALDRPTEFIRANNVSGSLPERTRTLFVYNDNLRFVRTRQDRNAFGDGLQRGEMHYDGMGREIETRTYEIVGNTDPEDEYIAVRRSYDALGRVRQTSNPFRIRPLNPETPIWTTTTYDALDRVYDVVTPDGQAMHTRYAGSATTVTDQAGKVRRSEADAQGRVVQLTEAPFSPAFNYQTVYTHNAFDQVTTARQGTQAARSFTYDSLGRMRSQSTPEGGTVSYSYDASGNLQSRSDARVAVNYGPYDGLDRPTTKSYVPATTPAVAYAYDNTSAPFSKGRLTRVANSVSATDSRAFDRLGRVMQSRQTTAGAPYTFSYSYDLAGNLTSRTYPSGRTVTSAYDRPGRVVSVQQAGAGSFPFADSALYAAHGALTRLKLGNGLWENTTAINNRLQPERVGLGTTDGGLERFRLDYTYNSAGQSDNNGNLRGQSIHAGSATMAQVYEYDEVNRLKKATEGTAWSQTFDYDAYGNRAVTAGLVLNTMLTPQSLSAFNPTNNRLNASAYDSAGNQSADPAGRSFDHDGENRQILFRGDGPEVIYSYDGEGRRVSKKQSTAERVFVYDAFGMLAAEYLTASNTVTGVQYATQDHLGSVRVVTDGGGNVVARHDYLPFGEEIPSNLGLRPQIFGYGRPDVFRQRFTGKPRDNESGLDYFEARYDSGAQGRFGAADQRITSSDHLVDPQRWNRYAYTRNNPLRFVDPDGRDPRTAIATLGEKLAADLLRQQGYTIILDGSRKAVTGRGFDIVAKKGSEVLAVDNKAFLSRSSASSATALTKNLEKSVSLAIKEIQLLVESGALSEVEKQAAIETIESLRDKTFQRVVTGAGGAVVRIGPKLVSAGVVFRALGAILGVLTFSLDASAAGETPFQESLTPEEFALYNRWLQGEDVFGAGSEPNWLSQNAR